MKRQISIAKTILKAILIWVASLTATQNAFALSFTDNFNSGIDPFWWATSTDGGSVNAVNQRVELTQGNAAAGVGTGLNLNPLITGDFMVQMDYTLLNWPADNRERLGLGSTDTLLPFPLAVERISDSGFGGEVYLTHFPDGVQGNTATSDTSGKLRLTRTGDTVSGYFWNGADWTLVDSYAASGEGNLSRHFTIAIWPGTSVAGGVTVAIDNFSLDAPNTPNPVPVPAAVWLFGSGLLGLIGVARHKRRS